MFRTRRQRSLWLRSTRLGLQVDVSAFWRGAIACTGTEFCKLAIAETKGFSKWLVSEMEERLPGFDQQIKLHVTGCTNSCGQHWIADIGLEGKKIKKDGQMVDAFYFCVGGAVGKFARTARPIGYRAAADEVPDAIERLLRGYLRRETPDEDLRAYFARTDDDSLRAQLAGHGRGSGGARCAAGRCGPTCAGGVDLVHGPLSYFPEDCGTTLRRHWRRQSC